MTTLLLLWSIRRSPVRLNLTMKLSTRKDLRFGLRAKSIAPARVTLDEDAQRRVY